MQAWRLDDFEASLTSLSDNTRRSYGADLRNFVTWCERARLAEPSEVERASIRRYLAWMTTRQLSRRTIARRTASLRRYFAWAVHSGLATVDPTSGVSTPAGDGRLPRVLEHRDLDRLLDGTSTSGVGAVQRRDEPEWRRRRDDAVLEILYGSGLRVAELCSLSVDSIDLAAGAATVWGKGGKERRVPLSEPARQAVHRWLAVRSEAVPDDVGPV
ncbi:MAG: tyrosine-type recombinase/integrase, partial [Actinomycetota bacterium]